MVRRNGDAPVRETLRVLTLNVRHGRGPKERPKVAQRETFHRHVETIAGFLGQIPAEVVALQEADAPSFWSGLVHHVEQFLTLGGFDEFAHGLHVNLCRPRFGLSYGTALLSKLPLAAVESRPFKARPLDTKGYVIATTSFAGQEVDVVSVHLDVFQPVQRRQAAKLIRDLRARPRPVVVMGDLNSAGRRPRSTVNELARALSLRAVDGADDMLTYPSWKPRHRLDWILCSEQLSFKSCRTIREPVSDHLAVEAELTWR